MSDTPPSIPPRKRPTTPKTGGATSSKEKGASVQSAEPDTTSSSSWASVSGNGSTAPPTYTVDVRGAAAPTAGRSTTPAGPRPTERPQADAHDEKASSSAPPAAGDPQPGDPEEPSPLVTAVDATSVWLKKAAGATSSGLSRAYSQLTRPRTEDASMTTTPTAGAATAERTSARTPAPATGATPRPATGRIPTVGGGPRRVRLAVSRVDPWSVMKLAFLLSVAIGIMIVVAAMVVWFTLDGLHVFSQVDNLVKQVVGPESELDILAYVSFEKTVSAATLVAVIDVFLLTALATIGAFLYNIVAALVGGVHVTMTDE